tara:strand:+ start:3214 stop:3387 length:174 start_codon:yes stop_codon:yes gene_type:complete
MATSANRRFTREQNRLKEKLNKQFLERIKGKSPEQIQQILEQIRIKYNLEPYNTENI